MNWNNIKGKKVALVGGAGFIGHNLAIQLKAVGAKVSVIDGLNVNNLLYLNQTNVDIQSREYYKKMIEQRLKLLRENDIPLYVEDARDYHKLTFALSKITPEVIVFLAAVAHANRSNKDPFSTFDHSFRTLENTLDYAKGGKVDQFIFFSSSMVYGNFNGTEMRENAPCEPLGIYGALKYGGEKLVIAYNQVFGLPYTIVRPSSLYGERCISRRVAQIFIENALLGKEIEISGDGSDRLDFTYIDDLVQGVVRVIDNPNSRNQLFNLTYGNSRSIAELAEIVGYYFPDVKVKYSQRDHLMPERGTLSVDKAKQMVGYTPSYPIEKGMEKYINWYRQNESLFRIS